MAMDYITEKQENKYQEYKQSSLLREAAIHVITGMSRVSAIEHVNEINYLREEAERVENVVRDEDGFVECYLESELNPPSEKGINKYQIDAIHKGLCESEGVEFE